MSESSYREQARRELADLPCPFCRIVGARMKRAVEHGADTDYYQCGSCGSHYHNGDLWSMKARVEKFGVPGGNARERGEVAAASDLAPPSPPLTTTPTRTVRPVKKDQQFPCSQCPEKFPNVAGLRSHMYKVHRIRMR